MGSIRPTDQSHNGFVNYMQMIRSMQFWIAFILSTPMINSRPNVICPVFCVEICQWNMADARTMHQQYQYIMQNCVERTQVFRPENISQNRWNVTRFVDSVAQWSYAVDIEAHWNGYFKWKRAARMLSLARWRLRNLGIFFRFLNRCVGVACSFLAWRDFTLHRCQLRAC